MSNNKRFFFLPHFRLFMKSLLRFCEDDGLFQRCAFGVTEDTALLGTRRWTPVRDPSWKKKKVCRFQGVPFGLGSLRGANEI